MSSMSFMFGQLLHRFISPVHSPQDHDPLGVIVLERVSVALDDNSRRKHAFKLEFDGPSTRIYYLAALDENSLKKWTWALRKSSYSFTRSVMLNLQQQLLQLTGKVRLSALQEGHLWTYVLTLSFL